MQVSSTRVPFRKSEVLHVQVEMRVHSNECRTVMVDGFLFALLPTVENSRILKLTSEWRKKQTPSTREGEEALMSPLNALRKITSCET